jgi:branched-chain amino acid transport system substrate-binding protein
VSTGGRGARIGSLFGVRSLRGPEAIRLTIAVALAAGAVALGESLSHGAHAAHGSTPRPGQASPAHAGESAHRTATGSGGQSSHADGVRVASGPAVASSLRHGRMTVVIDRPPPGLFSEQNRSIAQGATVAVDQLDAAGGLAGHIRVKLLSQSLDGLSVAALQSRLSSEAAAVLILPCDTDSQLSLAAEASQFGQLMLAPCNPDATAGGRYATYWPVGMAATDEAAGLTTFMRTLGYGRVFVVSAPGSSYVELVTSAFRSAAQTRGIQLAGSASIAMTTRNFTGLARAVEAIHPRPSAIFTALPPPFVNRLTAGLQAQGGDLTVLGSTAMDTPLTLSGGRRTMENATFASYGFQRVSASARHFAADYRARFGREPTGSFPGLGLETIRLLEAAVRKAGSAEPSAIQQALSGGIALQGVGLADRTYQAGGDHNPMGEVAVTKIASGSFLPLFADTPSTAASP